MKIYFKKLREDAIIPTRGTSKSAGLDIAACIDEPITLMPGERKKIPSGLSVAVEEENVVLLVYARSSLASKHGITLSNCVGVVDADYRGELLTPMINLSDEPYTIENGERIAQLVVTPIYMPIPEEVEELSETERGEGGFGSTGKK